MNEPHPSGGNCFHLLVANNVVTEFHLYRAYSAQLRCWSGGPLSTWSVRAEGPLRGVHLFSGDALAKGRYSRLAAISLSGRGGWRGLRQWWCRTGSR